MTKLNNAAIARYLKTLEEKAGGLRPDDVVAAARSPTSPIHGYFEWDDSEAAHQHRLNQARRLIRQVVVTVVHDDGPKESQCFVHTTSEGYRSVDVVVHRPDLFAEALAELTGKVEALRTAVINLQDAAQRSNDGDAAERLAMIAALATTATALHEAVRRIH